MDRTQILLVGLPLFLFFSDIINLFSPPPPPKPTHSYSHHHHPIPQQPQPHLQQPFDFPTQRQSGIGGPIGIGSTVNIDFCTSCSYKGTAVTIKNMLESAFPGINVVMANYPPPLPKRVLSKVIPVVQTGIIVAITAGDQIFPRLGITPPPLYYSLRANKFRSIASTWLLANFAQSFLQSSGAFEVYCNGDLVTSITVGRELWNLSSHMDGSIEAFIFGSYCTYVYICVFSKLKENRFPGEIELKKLVGERLANTRF